MEAPLGNTVRKILNDKDASKKLMQTIILGERFGDKNEFINIEDKKIKIHRVTSLINNIGKKTER